MALTYNMTNWKDQITQYPYKYTIINNSDGTVTLVPNNGTIIQAGTPIDAAHMNNMEQGIKNLYDNLDSIKVDLTSQNLNIIGLGIELETMKGSLLNGVNDDVVIEKFLDLSNVTIVSGSYDAINHNVSIL